MRKLLVVTLLVLGSVWGPSLPTASAHAPDAGIFSGTVTVGDWWDDPCSPHGSGLGYPWRIGPWIGKYLLEFDVTTAGHPSGRMQVCGDVNDLFGVYGCYWNRGHNGTGTWDVSPVHQLSNVEWTASGFNFQFSGNWGDGSSTGTFQGDGLTQHNPSECAQWTSRTFQVTGIIVFESS